MKQFIKILFLVLLILPFSLKCQEEKDIAIEKINKFLYENPDKAIEEGKKLVSSESDIDKKIKYLLYLSKAYTAKRNTDESLKTLLQAQELVNTSKDVKSKIDVLIIIAIQYQQMELYSKSFETLDEAEKLANELDPESEIQKNSWLGKSYAVKGMIYKSQGNNDIALEKFFKSTDFFEKSSQNGTSVNNLSVVYYNIAYCYFNEKDYKKAENYFLKSLIYAKKSKAQSLQAFALKGLAENYSAQNNHQKALQLLEEAKNKAQNIGDLVLNEGIYKGLAENYLSSGQFSEYLQNNDAYRKVQFEREQSELKSISSLITNSDAQYNAELKKINQKQNLIIWISVILGSIIATFLTLKILKKSKNNQLVREKIQELISK